MKSEPRNSLAETGDMSLDEETVAAFLLENPDFFTIHEDLLTKMQIPHKSGQAISLLERQVSLLRRQNEESQERIKDFISNAKENDQLFEKTRIIILEIINTASLVDLSALISEKLSAEFGATASRLFFASDRDVQDSVLFMLPLEQTKKVLGKLFQRKRAYCGNFEHEKARVFFPDAVNISSAAIIPIHLPEESEVQDRLPGIPLLLIASNNAKHFNSSLDTLFLDFIGEIVSAHIKGLLARQEPT